MRRRISWGVIVTAVLAIAAAALAAIPSVQSSRFNGWTGEKTVTVSSFYLKQFLVCGGLQILFGLLKGTMPRILGAAVSIFNLVTPWLILELMAQLGKMASDISTAYTIINPAPYIAGGLCLANVILQILRIRWEKQ